MQNKQIVAKSVSLLILCLYCAFLGGCVSLDSFDNNDVAQALEYRAEANIAITEELHGCGFITDAERDDIEDHIRDTLNNTLDKITDKNKKNAFLKAIVDWTCVPFEQHDGWVNNKNEPLNIYGITENEFNQALLTNEIVADNAAGNVTPYVPVLQGKHTAVEPIKMLEKNMAEDINERLNFSVYVLKKIDDDIALDGIVELVSTAVQDPSNIDVAVLQNYFEAAKDAAGNPITLTDSSLRENQFVADSIGCHHADENNVIVEALDVTNDSGLCSHVLDQTARPGLDMIVRMTSHSIPVLTVRLFEFNRDAIETMQREIGLSPDKYVFTNKVGNGDNRVYLMEYPIYYVNKIKEKGTNGSEFECEFEKSAMAINLKTRKLIKTPGAWGASTGTGRLFESSDPYLTLNGAPNNEAIPQAAFSLVDGFTPILKVGREQAEIEAGGIVLRDYLEASYAPDVVSGESVVVFGRKIRITNFSGDKENPMAVYVDKEGKIIENTPKLKVMDLADFDSLRATDPKIEFIGKNQTGTIKGAENQQGYEGTQASLTKIEGLDRTVVSEISPTCMFPSDELGMVDVGDNNKPLFYALAVNKGMFETALFSGWINSKNSEASLTWWQRWLANGNRAYNYSINKNIIEQYLVGNYTFELQQSGVVMLDLNVIKKINKDIKENKEIKTAVTIRTLFVLIGWGMMLYALLLMLLWVFDSYIDLNIQLLPKATFGKWVAVRDNIGIPKNSDTGKVYVTFTSMLMRVLVVAVVGGCLVALNMADVLAMIVDTFGGLAKALENLLR